MSSYEPSRNPISIIANVGAPVLVCTILVYRTASGHWLSVAFMGLIFVAVAFFYLVFVVPGLDLVEELDEESDASDS